MEQAPLRYAGFWKRFVATLIDNIVLGVVSLIVLIPVLGLFGLGVFMNSTDNDPEVGVGFILAAIGTWLFVGLLLAIAGWLYHALMESSAKGATLGKMALGIRVTDMNGNRITFGRATGRYFGKIVSGLILYIGFIMAGFTQQKQALHDIMAGCLVVNN